MERGWMRLRGWARSLGPGVVTGAADDDPSGIATYSIAGASTGFGLLWAIIVTVPMMAVLMGMCARIGIVTGRGVTAAIKREFPRAVVLPVLVLIVLANTLNVAADYSGMAAGARLILALPPAVWVAIFAATTIVVEIFFSYTAFSRIVKWLCLSLLAYVATAFLAHPDWAAVMRGIVFPHLQWNARWMLTALAVLGTTITPYLFIWQSSMSVEERASHPRRRTNGISRELADAHGDVNSGVAYSNVVSLFIIVTTAATLGRAHVSVATAYDAAQALRPLAGDLASLLFAAGIVCTGLLAVPVIAGASAYALADYFGWEDSLSDKPRQAPFFYLTIAVSVVVGVALGASGLDAMNMLLYSACFNGIAVVPLIYFVVVLSRRASLLGERTSSRTAAGIGWLALGLMAATSLLTFGAWIAGVR